ncbi:MAG: SAM-dependent chlorinase/fluorinase [Bacteroidetes bacterium]|nr:SAM-dependent chlorinase/fluorinase [Bacteroidota bacterium]
MPIITITTDLGYRDPYLAMVKGILYQNLEGMPIVDLATSISKHAHSDAAFALKSAMPFFPAGTIHLVAVKNNNTTQTQKELMVDNTRYLLTQYQGQYIMCPDNGLLTLIDKHFLEPVYQLYFDSPDQHAFYLRDVFTGAAIKLARNTPIEEFAHETGEYCKLYQFDAYATPGNLSGFVIYEDDFGNMVTNITRDEFNRVVGNKRFAISLPAGTVTRIYNTYDDVGSGDVVCFFNALGLLEIATNAQPANKLLKGRSIQEKYKLDKITIDIYD